MEFINIDFVLIVIFVSIIQSLFGVGVLLFGTPLFLILGYQFFESLLILLPISLSINFLQLIKGYKEVNISIYKNIIIFTVPLIVITLSLISHNSIDVNLFIGLFLIFIALKNYIVLFDKLLDSLLMHNKLFYILMGIVHGITNLGGALLTAKIFHASLNKYQTRSTIALSYMTFALFQILTILFLDIEYKIENIYYILIGIIIYILTHKFLFHKITDSKYNKLFAIFLSIFGFLLIYKGMIW